MDAAKRYRVDAEKLQKAVAKEFAAKRDKKTVKSKARKTAAGVDPCLMFGGVLVWGLSSNGTENRHKVCLPMTAMRGRRSFPSQDRRRRPCFDRRLWVNLH